MGSFANSLFKFLLGWLQGAVAAVWSAFTSKDGSALFNWIGRYWMLIAGILCVIGLAADLCVYLFRWKPFRVWKSFFFRGRQDDDSGYGDQRPERPAEQGRAYTEPEQPTVRERPIRVGSETGEPDLSQWEPEPVKTEQAVRPAGKPATVTNAGYVVPADSPYRRPEKRGPDTVRPVQEQEESEGSVSLTPRRRRRISVSELFSDPEEEMKEFDAPQQIIDSRRAYRDPVYPSGWKKNGEDGHDSVP